jgi:hypothetical protein
VKAGDMVEIQEKLPDSDGRKFGTILRFDAYTSDLVRIPEPIVEVLWNAGHKSWILKSRVTLHPEFLESESMYIAMSLASD